MASYSAHEQREGNDKVTVLCQLLEMFDSSIDKSIIESVAESCNYTVEECIDVLINCVENLEVRSIYAKNSNKPVEDVSSTDQYQLYNVPGTSQDQFVQNEQQDQNETKDETTKFVLATPDFNSQNCSATEMKDFKSILVQCDRPMGNFSFNLKSEQNASNYNSRCHFKDESNSHISDHKQFISASKSFEYMKISDKIKKKLEQIENHISCGYKVLIILRGLPGSGKSYLGKYIINRTFGLCNTNNFIFSTDDTFIDANGEYSFDSSKLKEGHAINYNKVLHASEREISPIIVDNTNTQLWEMTPYINIAINGGYLLHILEPDTPWAWNVNALVKRNVHSVPRYLINRMKERYEHSITVDQCLQRLNLTYSLSNFPPQMRRYPPLEMKEDQIVQISNAAESIKRSQVQIPEQLKSTDKNIHSNEYNLIDLNFTDEKMIGNEKQDHLTSVSNDNSKLSRDNAEEFEGDNINDRNDVGSSESSIENENFIDITDRSNDTNELLKAVTKKQEVFDLMCMMKSFLSDEDNASVDTQPEEDLLENQYVIDEDSSDSSSNLNDDLNTETNQSDYRTLSMENDSNIIVDKNLSDNCKLNKKAEIPEMSLDAVSLYNTNDPEIIDNMNSISWKEFPFPACAVPFTQKVGTVKKIPTTDCSTNTCAKDFYSLYCSQNSADSSCKILYTKSRDVNNCLPRPLMERKIQSKLMLDKSSMTDSIEASYTDILSTPENDGCRNKCLESLIEMFPDVPKNYITSVYINVCNYDLNWATEIILDESSQEQPRYEIEDVSKLDTINLNIASSSKEEDKNILTLPGKSTPRKRENYEERIALQKHLENTLQIKGASYHPHILRVKRWKQREPDMEYDEITSRALNREVIEFGDTDYNNDIRNDYENEMFDNENVASDNENSESESNPSLSSSSNSSPDEMIELQVGKEFIESLEQEFGNSDFQFSGAFLPVIQMKKSKAQELYALWLESMQEQQKNHQLLIDNQIKNDEEYARSMQEQEQEEENLHSPRKIVDEVNQTYNFKKFYTMTQEEKKTYADKVRQKGMEEYTLSRQCLTKAQEAYSNSDEEGGRMHAKVAERHNKKSVYLYMLASNMFVTLNREKYNEETLDLHYLFVKEALEAVEIFLSYHVEKLKANTTQNRITLFIITGRGLNSNGRCKLKPAVCKQLKHKGIRFTEANAGCLRITLRKKNLLYLNS